jgi:DNA polymerase II small subunit
MPGATIKLLVKELSGKSILVSGDVSGLELDGIPVEILASRIVSALEGREGIRIADRVLIDSIVAEIKGEKSPDPIEVAQRTDFMAPASEIDARYTIASRENDRSGTGTEGFVSYFRNRLARLRSIIGSQRAGVSMMVQSIENLKSYSAGREVTIVGMVSNRVVTKNGNIMVILDDETGDSRVIFMNGTSQKAKELFEKARRIVNDEVMAVNGKISGPFLIADEIIWPDVPIKQRTTTEDDIAIAFISDTHAGSKLFMERNFANMIKWLNGGIDEKRGLAGKVKYVVFGGDVVDGIGVYPNQDRELSILDIYSQYKLFMNMISSIPDYIQVFVIPGNHDAVQRAEPQPSLTPQLLRDFRADNIHMLPNPSFLSLHGVDVLAYHGTSLDSMIRSIPGLTYADPAPAMIELLRRRHLSPIYGGNIIVPSSSDNLVIDRIPDILHMGHVHKNALSNYHGVDILNSGTWQSRTEFQVIQGHIPSPCVLTVYETKESKFTTINFER